MDEPTDIVGHKSFDTGDLSHEGFPVLRHEPITRAEAEAIFKRAEEAKVDRARRIPDEQSAIRTLFDGWLRLKELGWEDGIYAPKDGRHFRTIQLGSTGIFDCVCEGEWPHCTWTSFDERDAYPSSQAPAMFKVYDVEAATPAHGEGRDG